LSDKHFISLFMTLAGCRSSQMFVLSESNLSIICFFSLFGGCIHLYMCGDRHA